VTALRTRHGAALALAVGLLVATIPVAPALFLVPAVAIGLLLVHRTGWDRTTTTIAALVALGCCAQVVGHLARSSDPAQVAQVAWTGAGADAPTPPPAVANLIANSDLSWLRTWSDNDGLTDYAVAVASGIWRIPGVASGSAVRTTEALTAIEVPVEAGVPYTLSVMLRHDGSSFEGELLFQTRDGRIRPGTTLEPIGEGQLRATATLPARDAPGLLRVLHLTGLGGDWTHLDVGLAQLVAGTEALPFRPNALTPPWFEGVLWWLGLGVALVATAPTVRAAVASVGRRPLALGLLAGLAVQAAWAGGEAWGGGARAAGSLGEPNLLAHAAIVTALAIGAVSPRPLRDGLAALVLAAIVIGSSGSRAGLVGLLVGWPLLAAALPLARAQRRRLLLAAALVVGVGAIVAVAVGSRLITPLTDDANLTARMQAWQTAVDVAAAHPLVGNGHGRFALAYEFWKPDEQGPRYRNNHAHNAFLELAAGFGWPVALGFVALLGALWARLWGAGAAPVGVALAVALLVNLVDVTLFHAAVFLPLVLAATVSLPAGSGSARGPAPLARRHGAVHV